MAFRLPQFTVYLASLVFVFAAAGCGGSAESELEARLNLAQSNGDLDEMFVTLTQLSKPQNSDPSYNSMLINVETAIDDRHAMRAALAAHDLETALHAANRIYGVFPKNIEAIEAARGASRIYSALEQANAELAAYKAAYESHKGSATNASNDGTTEGDGDAKA